MKTNSYHQEQSMLLANTILHLLDFERYANFEEAISHAAISDHFQVVIFDSSFNTVFAIETQKKTTIEKTIMVAKQKNIANKHQEYTVFDVEGVRTYWKPITIQGTSYYLLIVDNHAKYTNEELAKLSELIKITMGIWQYTPHTDHAFEFIRALRNGHLNKAEMLAKELGIKDEQILSAFYINESKKGETQLVIDKYVDGDNLKIIRIIDDDRVYGVVLGEYTPTVCVELFREIWNATDDAKIGHITGMDSIIGLVEAFQLIEDTRHEASVVFPQKSIFAKYDLLLVRNCKMILQDIGRMKKNYMDLLAPFQIEKSAKGRTLLETLEVFMLDADMNATKTAQMLGIHTNTVQYRLKNINKTLGADITGNRVMPGLVIGLALHRLERF